MNSTLIVRPDISFQMIEQSLDRFAWERSSNGPLASPLLPDEPEFASWSRRGGNISYTFNPVVNLRVLAFYGEHPEADSSEISDVVPTLQATQIRKLLESRAARDILLGLFASRELRALEMIAPIAELQTHPHPTISKAAVEALGHIVAEQIDAGVDRFKSEKQRHPERSVLFSSIGDVGTRQQALRWLIHDYASPNEHIVAVLRSGLVDENWEVRFTAMLAAAHFGARQLAADVTNFDLLGNDGWQLADRELLEAIRSAVLGELRGSLADESAAQNSDTNISVDLTEQLRRLLRHIEPKLRDRAYGLVHGLTAVPKNGDNQD